MKTSWLRLWADYGGMLNAAACVLHCAAGPALLAAWGARPGASPSDEAADLVFVALSAGLTAAATWRWSSGGLRLALWGWLLVFAAATLLADDHPVLRWVQYAASVGLAGTHLLNLRYCRHCLTAPLRQPEEPAP